MSRRIPLRHLKSHNDDTSRMITTIDAAIERSHLYETFGMPLDFMVDAARDAGIDFDYEGFEAGEAGGAAAGAGELEGRVAEDGGAGVSRTGEDGV